MNQPKRILIVDDEEPYREFLRVVLESLGYEPEIAKDGFEALAKVKLDIDLVLLDIMCPEWTGSQWPDAFGRTQISATYQFSW